MTEINVTSHMSLLLKWSQRQRSIQGFAQNTSNDGEIDYFIGEGLI